jgi:hypothetical protein
VVDERFAAGFEGERRADGWLDLDDAGEPVAIGPPPSDAALEDQARVEQPVPEQLAEDEPPDPLPADEDELDWGDDGGEVEEVAAAAVPAAGARDGVRAGHAGSSLIEASSYERHQFDPFEEPQATRRRLRRREVTDVPYVEVAAGQPRAHGLPGEARKA